MTMSAYSATQPFKVGSVPAGADLSAKQYHFVKLAAGPTIAVVNGTTNRVLGVLANRPLSGDPCEVVVQGVVEVVADGTIAVNDVIYPSADGQAMASGTVAVGIALTAGAAGDLVTVVLATQVLAGTVVGAQADIVALTDSTGGAANNTVAALPVLTDAPATADALRDDIVTNMVPVLAANFADLTAKVNAIRTALRASGLMS